MTANAAAPESQVKQAEPEQHGLLHLNLTFYLSWAATENCYWLPSYSPSWLPFHS